MAITNDEALAVLTARRSVINSAINELNRHVRERSDWKAAVATSNMAEVKRLATAAGVDITAWDGNV
jgi:hypothetical protein